MTDQRFKILIFYYRTGQTSGCLADQRKEFSDITWLAAKGSDIAAIAVTKHLVKSNGLSQIRRLCIFLQDRLDVFKFRLGKVMLCQN